MSFESFLITILKQLKSTIKLLLLILSDTYLRNKNTFYIQNLD